MSIEGRTYLERGEPVTVVIQWGRGGGPRNVLIERADGAQTVRPFRGLRKPVVVDDEPTFDEIAAEKRSADL
jgi:acetyl esterase